MFLCLCLFYLAASVSLGWHTVQGWMSIMSYCLENRKEILGLVTAISAVFSTCLLIGTISSNHLLVCVELNKMDSSSIPDPPPTSSLSESVFISTNFGLWRACSRYTGTRANHTFFCLLLHYATMCNADFFAMRKGSDKGSKYLDLLSVFLR